MIHSFWTLNRLENLSWIRKLLSIDLQRSNEVRIATSKVNYRSKTEKNEHSVNTLFYISFESESCEDSEFIIWFVHIMVKSGLLWGQKVNKWQNSIFYTSGTFKLFKTTKSNTLNLINIIQIPRFTHNHVVTAWSKRKTY